MPMLKKLFWLYFLLLIFEGALRKWLLPGLSAPLLLVRDPVAVLIIIEAYRTNKWPERWSVVIGVLAFALLGLCVLQVILGDNSWIAAVYGLRSYLLPFPVAFIMGENLDAEDLRKFGLCTIWLLLPLTALEVAQYLAPPTSFLNKGAYEGGGQLFYVESHTRASATFSFVAGPTNYVPMAAAFVLYGLMHERFAKKWLLWAATGALILSVPVIGARAVAFLLAGVIGCAAIAALLGGSQLAKVAKVTAPVMALFFLISLLPVFSEATISFKQRFQEANAEEGGGSTGRVIANRTLGPVQNQLATSDFLSDPIGKGMGRGAAAISKLTTGQVTFLTGEGEFGRVLTELGPFPGVAFMLFRLILALVLIAQALAEARRQEPLALLMAPMTMTAMLFGVSEQPTEQGFTVIGMAFTLAALKLAKRQTAPTSIQQAQRMPMRYSMPINRP
jgi:hypothetical protein